MMVAYHACGNEDEVREVVWIYSINTLLNVDKEGASEIAQTSCKYRPYEMSS